MPNHGNDGWQPTERPADMTPPKAGPYRPRIVYDDPKPMTNYDYLHKASVEELADFFSKNIECGDDECFVRRAGMCNVTRGCRESFRNWLNLKKEKPDGQSVS